MKFSHSIQFNAVPDWSSYYIAYSNLKKLIYTLEKKANESPGQGGQGEDEEHTALIREDFNPDLIFKRALDNELDKIAEFFQIKELELYGEVNELIKDEEEFNQMKDSELSGSAEWGGTSELIGGSYKRRSTMASVGSAASPIFGKRPRRKSTASAPSEDDRLGSDSDDSDVPMSEGAAIRRNTRRKTVANVPSDALSDATRGKRRGSLAYEDFNDGIITALFDRRITLKKRTVSLYVSLVELKSFIQLNRTGFSKALKKYDKILNRSLRDVYIEKYVTPAHVFQKTTIAELNTRISNIESVYADLITNGDAEAARKELRLHLREHVVWERNTVWREMIGIERKAQAANMGLKRTLLGPETEPRNARLQGDEPDTIETKELSTPIGRFRCPAWLLSSSFWTLLLLLAVFATLLVVPIFKEPEQQRCFAMLVFVSLLWATEVIPLFVTSLLVPFLVVVLRVVREDRKPHERLDAKDATKYIFCAMWTPVIMLLLGGFTLAAALSKYHIAKMIATMVLSKAGTKPRTVLLTTMFVAMVSSMWISNVAAPVLCYSIIQPILRNLPADSSMSKALILGIALSSNIGGMASPIASPQNIIALQNMKPEPGWGEWFAIALPVCFISIILIWLLLLVSFQPGKGTNIVPIRPMKDKFTGIQWFITIVTIITILLWCITHQLENIFGDMGVVAIIPILLFFGTGILTKEDFNNFLWTIIILAAGGLSLGKAVNSSGLLHTIAYDIQEKVHGLSMYGVLIVFASLILIIATFISHTVAALIVLPIVAQVGSQMDDPHPRLLVMGAALMCSGAMGLPTSGFPNMTAIMMEDSHTGQRYLRVKHFISRGIPSSLIAFLVTVTVGYGLMIVVGF